MRTSTLATLLLGLFAFFVVSLPHSRDGSSVQSISECYTSDGVEISGCRSGSLSPGPGKTSNGNYEKRAPPPKTPAPKAPAPKAPAPAAPKVTKSKNYEVVEKAAKGTKLVVGQSYLLIARVGLHKQLIVGTVTEKPKVGSKTGEKELDVEAAMSELRKDTGNGSTFSQICKTFYGGTCSEKHVENYSCERGAGSGTSYKFVSAANVDFADKAAFIQKGEFILAKNTKYNILTNSCWTHAKKLANVTKQ